MADQLDPQITAAFVQTGGGLATGIIGAVAAK